MAQSGFTPISLYFSATGAAVPTAANLVAGELALNTNDGKLYYKNSSGVVTLLAGATSGPAGGSNTQVQYNNSGVLAGITGATSNGTALTLVAPVLGTPASGTVTNLTGTASININGTVGATTANTGAFTTVTASTPIGTASGGTGLGGATPFTSGGVVYASSTSALATGSALTFDGTQLYVNGGASGFPLTLNNSTGSNTNLQFSENNVSKWLLRNITGDGGFSFFNVVANSEGMRLTSTGLQVTNTLSGGTSGTAYSFSGSAPATSLTLDSSGNLGIGTSSPISKLTVLGAGTINAPETTTTGGSIQTASYGITTRTGNLELGATDARAANIGGSLTFSARYTSTNATWVTGKIAGYRETATDGVASSYLAFATSTSAGDLTERARIDSSGNLLVGKTSTSFSTAGMNFTAGGLSELVATSSTVIAVNRLTTDGDIVDFYRQTSKVGSIAVTTTGVTLTGTNGITFTASQTASADANTLDDYEEGTWTPNLTGDGGGSGQSYTSQTGTYTKVGRLVTVNFFINLSAKGTITGNVIVDNLPFTVLNTGSLIAGGALPLWQNLAVNHNVIGIYCNTNTTNIYFWGSTGTASGPPILTTTDIGNTTRFWGSATYMTAT